MKAIKKHLIKDRKERRNRLKSAPGRNTPEILMPPLVGMAERGVVVVICIQENVKKSTEPHIRAATTADTLVNSHK